MSEPRTEAGRRLFDEWKHNPKELWTYERVIDAILAIEAEAAAGPRDQHGWSAEDYERLAAAGPRDYPCIRCGSPLDDCDYDRRCCDDHDHPYATATETIRALNEDREAEAAAGPRERTEAEWSALLEDIIGLWATGAPDLDDVLDKLAEYRAEAAAGPRDDGLDVERWAEVLHARHRVTGSPAGAMECCGGQARKDAREYAALAATTGAAPSESEERS